MAHKIAVVERLSGDVRRHLKRRVAEWLVHRSIAEWVVENVSVRIIAINRLPTEALRFKPETVVKARLTYIPVNLPPREVPGVVFVPPANAQPVLGQIEFCRGEIAYA